MKTLANKLLMIFIMVLGLIKTIRGNFINIGKDCTNDAITCPNIDKFFEIKTLRYSDGSKVNGKFMVYISILDLLIVMDKDAQVSAFDATGNFKAALVTKSMSTWFESAEWEATERRFFNSKV